jgi:hypothetical protein
MMLDAWSMHTHATARTYSPTIPAFVYVRVARNDKARACVMWPLFVWHLDQGMVGGAREQHTWFGSSSSIRPAAATSFMASVRATKRNGEMVFSRWLEMLIKAEKTKRTAGAWWFGI